MVEHLVLFQLKPEATEEQRSAMLLALAGLQQSVPTIRDLSVGQNFSPRSQGFEYGLVVRFESRDGLEKYISHPAHVEVVERWIKPITTNILAVDYEF